MQIKIDNGDFVLLKGIRENERAMIYVLRGRFLREW